MKNKNSLKFLLLMAFIFSFGANAFPAGDEPFSIALLDTTAGFTVLRDLNNEGFFEPMRAPVTYLTAPTPPVGSGFFLTSALTSSNENDMANFSLLGKNSLDQNFRFAWQVEKGSGITEDALSRVLDLAVQARTGDVNGVALDNAVSRSDVTGFSFTFNSDGEEAISGYSLSMNIGPSQRHYFWRTFGELMFLNSLGVLNYFLIQREDNMVDWEYKLNREDARKKITDGWCLDTNNFRTNSIYHIYSGIIYYQTARSNNYGPWGSFVWTFAASTFWEYIGEYREQVSTNDQIFTPMGGVIFGEGLRQLGLWAERSMPRGFARGLVCFVLDPMRIVNRQLDRWVGESFVVNVNFVNPAQSMISKAVLEGRR